MVFPKDNFGGDAKTIFPTATKPTVSKFCPGVKGFGIITEDGTTSVVILAAISPSGIVPVISFVTVRGIEPVKPLFRTLKLAHPVGSSIVKVGERTGPQLSKLKFEA